MLQRAAGGAAAGAAAVAADGAAQRDGQPEHVAALVVEEAQRPTADARLREEHPMLPWRKQNGPASGNGDSVRGRSMSFAVTAASQCVVTVKN